MKNRLFRMSIIILTFTPTAIFADGYGWNGGWEHHMGGFMGGGWMMILWIGILLLVIFSVVKWATTSKKKPTVTSDAQSILAMRYAKGEITQQEFTEMKKNL